MRQSRRTLRVVGTGVPALLVAALSIGAVTGFGSSPAAVGSVAAPTSTAPKLPAPPVVPTIAPKAPASTAPAPAPTTSIPAPTPAPIAPATVAPVPASRFASGNAQLDALLATLPGELFAGGATVHFGYNPVDCCHAGGYNPEPNEVWVSERALTSSSRLVYVTVHELAHSLHLHSPLEAALTAAVAGAPVVRAGSPWDDSEKVADCVAWAKFPAETAASGLSYWSCPDPWRTQVRAALRS